MYVKHATGDVVTEISPVEDETTLQDGELRRHGKRFW